MARIAVGILARDNEDDIAACLASADWADERIVILDTRSGDHTAAIAQHMGARVLRNEFVDFARQREFGLGVTDADWLFYLDSDERATPDLAREIREVVEQPGHVGWWVPRRNFLFGQEIRHGGWHPDYQLRLLKRGSAHYDLGRPVHEIVELVGSAGYLREPLVHHNYHSLGQFVAKQRQYVGYEAQILYQEGIRPKPWTQWSQPVREFWRRYVRLQGFRDGVLGVVLCGLVAYYYGYRVTLALRALWRQ